MPQHHTSAKTVNTGSNAAAHNTSATGIAQPAVKPVFREASPEPEKKPAASPAPWPLQQKQAVAQLKVAVAGSSIARDLKLAKALIEAKHDEDDFYKKIGEAPGIGNLAFETAKDIYNHVKAPGHAALKVIKQLQEWDEDDSIDHKFDSWGHAVHEAYKAITGPLKMGGLMHIPSPPASPYTDDQQDFITHLSGPGRTAEHMGPTDDWRELKIQGQIGEYAHQQHLESTGFEFRDANELFGYNAAGLDTVSNSDTPFGQSKMHLGTTESPEELLATYMAHIDKAPDYARKFLTSLFTRKPNGKKMRAGLKAINDVWKNKHLEELYKYAKDDAWADDSTALEAEEGEDGAPKQVAPVELVLNGLVFPIPSDVYDIVPAEYQAWFERLPYKLYWYRKVKQGLRFKHQRQVDKKAKRKMDDTDYAE